MTTHLTLDPTACSGHGLCAALFPEGITLDDWGFAILTADVPPEWEAHAKRAVRACPVVALRLSRTVAARRG
jgi:ferredoxin